MNRPIGLTIKIYLAWICYMPIVGFSYFVTWLDRKMQFKLAFPRDVEQLTGDKPWLIAELKESNTIPADAVIDSCEVTPLNQTIIFRSNAGIIDIRYTVKGEQRSLKCFAKFAPTMGTVWNKTIFNLQVNHLKEAWFNQYFLTENSEVPSPRVYCSKVSPLLGHLCLITEHMGDDIEYHEYPYKSFPVEHLDMALDGLAALHARYWGDTSKRMDKVFPIEDIVVNMFESMVAGSWTAPTRKVLVRSWTLMNEHQTVLHGDSRIGNMMFPASVDRGRFVLIDWQAVRKGKAAFDVAYFLVLSLMTTHRKELEPYAREKYYGQLIGKGVAGYSRSEFEEDYRHGCLCTLVLLALPMLSGEVSADGDAALLFAFGMGIWRERLRQFFADFDYIWMAQDYTLTEGEAKAAVAEMIAVIDARLNGVLKTGGSKDTLIDVLRRSNVANEFDV